ncbi:hypothetical protein ABTY53_12935 [Streptomyces noursei]|uniref:hypothetical protein n=1 Tax=Streptomyces noursei TaxID=1971 RepID=UPI003332727E
MSAQRTSRAAAGNRPVPAALRWAHPLPANFCWFRDPAKALCLKLAGTPDAKKPLIGMCDSARCPQATHHPCHRPVWLGQGIAIDTFINNRRVAQGEKKRLKPERERAVRVLAEIDTATGAFAAEAS